MPSPLTLKRGPLSIRGYGFRGWVDAFSAGDAWFEGLAIFEISLQVSHAGKMVGVRPRLQGEADR